MAYTTHLRGDMHDDSSHAADAGAVSNDAADGAADGLDVAALTEGRGRVCLILSLPGCPPCAALKNAILERHAPEDLSGRVYDVRLDAHENRDHRAFIRAEAVTGFPTVQLYEDGEKLWQSPWAFDDDVLESMLAWLLGDAEPPLTLPDPLEPTVRKKTQG